MLARYFAEKVIVFDDVSSNRTTEVAANARAEIVVHITNKGKVIKGETDMLMAAVI